MNLFCRSKLKVADYFFITFYLIGAGPIGILAAQCAAAEGILFHKTDFKKYFKAAFNI